MACHVKVSVESCAERKKSDSYSIGGEARFGELNCVGVGDGLLRNGDSRSTCCNLDHVSKTASAGVTRSNGQFKDWTST